MTIKEVEKLTGLTAKSIRLYEEKGLISVIRNEENDYRIYTEENVTTLKRIKILRYLNFSISEIKEILEADEDTLKTYFDNKSNELDNMKLNCDINKEFCKTLADDFNDDSKLDGYSESIAFAESEEFFDLMAWAKEGSHPSISFTIVLTVICIAPLLNLILDVKIGNTEGIIPSAIFSFLGAIFIALGWKDYFTKRKENKFITQENNRKTAFAIPGIILAIMVSIGFMIGVGMLQERAFDCQGWIFMEMPRGALDGMLSLIVIGVIGAAALFMPLPKKRVVYIIAQVVIVLSLVAWFVVFYCSFTTVNVVTDEYIIMHSPLKPIGVVHTLDEVDSVDTGFRKSGEFYYTVTIDGKKASFAGPTVNSELERYKDDTYLELEDFDKKLVALGVEKTSSTKNIEKCGLEKQFVDRFERIVNLR